MKSQYDRIQAFFVGRKILDTRITAEGEAYVILDNNKSFYVSKMETDYILEEVVA